MCWQNRGNRIVFDWRSCPNTRLDCEIRVCRFTVLLKGALVRPLVRPQHSPIAAWAIAGLKPPVISHYRNSSAAPDSFRVADNPDGENIPMGNGSVSMDVRGMFRRIRRREAQAIRGILIAIEGAT